MLDVDREMQLLKDKPLAIVLSAGAHSVSYLNWNQNNNMSDIHEIRIQ